MPRRYDWNRSEVKMVLELYESGRTLKDIARIHNERYKKRSVSSITNCITENTESRRKPRRSSNEIPVTL